MVVRRLHLTLVLVRTLRPCSSSSCDNMDQRRFARDQFLVLSATWLVLLAYLFDNISLLLHEFDDNQHFNLASLLIILVAHGSYFFTVDVLTLRNEISRMSINWFYKKLIVLTFRIDHLGQCLSHDKLGRPMDRFS